MLNGTGEMTGLAWVAESGFLEYPIALTNTLNIPRVANGVMSWMIKRYPGIGISDDTHWEITDGLQEGQEVVSGGYRAISRELDDGKRVKKGAARGENPKEKEAESSRGE